MSVASLHEDRDTGVWTMTLDGAVTLADAPSAGAVLDKCLAKCPAAIVVDLRHADFDTVTMPLPPTWQRRADQAGVSLEVVAVGELARRIRRGPARHTLAVHRDVAQAAAAALDRPGRRWTRQRLTAEPLAAVAARNTVGDVCLAWGLRPLLHRSRFVVSELVDNALAHAGTDMELTVGVSDMCLHIRVRDGHPAVPQPRRPRAAVPGAPLDLRGAGLALLAEQASAWGHTRHPDGKTVWATLLLPPITDASGDPAAAT